MPSTFSNKPVKQNVIGDRSLTASSNGSPDTCDVEGTSLPARTDITPTKTSVMSLGHKNVAVHRTGGGCNSDNALVDEKNKRDINLLPGKKKYAIGKPKAPCNDYTNIKPSKDFRIPEIFITKYEMVSAEDDEYDSS